MFKLIDGGVCAAKGFKASGVHCGIRKNRTKRDLSLIFSEVEANAAAIYTTNLVKGAPLTVTKDNLSDGKAQAMLCNSGNANTCNSDGIEIANAMCECLAKEMDISSKSVIVASTGVIGEHLPLAPIEAGIPALVKSLSSDGCLLAAEGIMTTDTVVKEVAVEFEIDGITCRLGGIAKGSGMIHPNMATMLVFLTSDVAISSDMLSYALKTDVSDTFNMVSVDGDTSTNDMVSIMANGLAGNKTIESKGEAFEIFMKALNTVTVCLCKKIAGDGEGATRLMKCKVCGAKCIEDARKAAKSVICSSLVKSMIFGADANYGRVLCAVGYSSVAVDPEAIDVSFVSAKGKIDVCKNGMGIPFSEEIAKEILLEKEIEIIVDLHAGNANATAWGCDLTYEYVKINGDYRT